MSTPTPGGDRRTDHRAYAVACPRPKCSAAPWRACVGRGGKPLDEPHRERVDAERGVRGGKGTTPEQRTVPMFDEDGTPNLEGIAEVGNAVNRQGKIDIGLNETVDQSACETRPIRGQER